MVRFGDRSETPSDICCNPRRFPVKTKILGNAVENLFRCNFPWVSLAPFVVWTNFLSRVESRQVIKAKSDNRSTKQKVKGSENRTIRTRTIELFKNILFHVSIRVLIFLT